jgi:PAS domain S-box-containing protein
MSAVDGITFRPITTSVVWKRRPAMLKAPAVRCDVGTAVANLTDDLLGATPCSLESASDALDRLRRAVQASHAAVWLIEGTRATCAVQSAAARSRSADAVEADAATIARLRHHPRVICRSSELTGLERLVPKGIRSFAAATGRSHATLGALVVGWNKATPPCDEAAAVSFRIAATLLVNALASAAPAAASGELADAILGSLSERIAVLDRQGTIIAVNGVWSDFWKQQPDRAGDIGPGANFLDAWRRLAKPSSEMLAALDGIEAVCAGTLESFEAVHACDLLGDMRSCATTVRPLRRPEGGAVILQRDMTAVTMAAVPQRRDGGEPVHRFAEAMPVPFWLIAPHGRVALSNQPFAHVEGHWTDYLHPDDRTRARSAFERALAHRTRFDMEVRLIAPDGAYRWCRCMARPQLAPDGHVEFMAVVAVDISAKRRAESAVGEIAAKLVAAQEAERTHIARELHDDLGQQLALMLSQLDSLDRIRPQSLNRLRFGLAAARRALQDIAVTVHTLSHRLHPGKLKLLGLMQTLESLCRDVSREGDVAVTFESRDIPSGIAEDTALCLFRVAQEALQNAVKHSRARTVRVMLNRRAGKLVLRIADEGKGFDMLASRQAGLGLITMRERVELCGGSLTIETVTNHGTAIEAIVPLALDARAARATAQ